MICPISMTCRAALLATPLVALLACQPAGESSTPASEVGEATPAASDTVAARPQTIPLIGTCIGCDADSLIAHFGLREADAPVRDRSDWSPPQRALVIPDPLLLARLEAAELDIELLVPEGFEDAVRMAGEADVIVGWPCARQLVEAATAVRFWQYASAGVEPCTGGR